MELAPKILFGRVMHKRLFPRANAFNYGIYYIACPLSQIKNLADGWRFNINKFGLLSFYERDHGARDGSDLNGWAKNILEKYNVKAADGEIVLITLPRVLGYVFNPVSFWLCYDKSSNIRAVICEVNNTFGETHSYLCAHHDHRPIEEDDWLEGEKLFHVSPFMTREGFYKFRFAIKSDKVRIHIDYYDGTQKKKLLTAVTADQKPFSRAALRKAFWAYPLITIKTIFLIHWQAIKLVLKKIQYVPKPVQKNEKLSTTKNL